MNKHIQKLSDSSVISTYYSKCSFWLLSFLALEFFFIWFEVPLLGQIVFLLLTFLFLFSIPTLSYLDFSAIYCPGPHNLQHFFKMHHWVAAFFDITDIVTYLFDCLVHIFRMRSVSMCSYIPRHWTFVK